MDVLSSSTESTDPVAEVRRLRRQLRRERALRQTAETVGARATAHLHDSVRGMRSTQADLLERADQDQVVDELSQALREDLDSAHLVNRAAESVGRSTAVDRCDVLLVDAERFSAVRGTWSSSEETAALPRPGSFVDLPEALTTLLLEAAQHLEPVQIDDVDQDERLGAPVPGRSSSPSVSTRWRPSRWRSATRWWAGCCSSRCSPGPGRPPRSRCAPVWRTTSCRR